MIDDEKFARSRSSMKRKIECERESWSSDFDEKRAANFFSLLVAERF